ncbi:biotin-independent malonate decarboxylase subunit gamma [Vibrio jasicida]|uniref:Biotin-independent malonate decarboxylase subunit gamma n=1 Tax=Vibrio jasicida TaxID=766224 RepID=A0ABW7JFB5_9VIBR
MSNRGLTWLESLTEQGQAVEGFVPSVNVIDSELNGQAARFIAVVVDENNYYPRAKNGEVGLLEGWNVAKAVQQVIAQDSGSDVKTPIVAVIDVPSQAYGRREEGYGIHLALAAAANAYAQARNAGHPILGLIVGKAMSGGFLAHGYQASRLISLNDEGCMVHAMGKASAARITLRSVEQLEALAATIPPMAYDIQNYSTLGLLWKIVDVEQATAPTTADVTTIKATLVDALNDIKQNGNDLSQRLQGKNRKATLSIRQQMEQAW